MTWGFKGFGRAAAPIFIWPHNKPRYMGMRVQVPRRAGLWRAEGRGGLVQGCGGADKPGSRR